MMGATWKATVVLVLLTLSPGGEGLFRSVYRNVRVSVPREGDAGRPLLLTPYVEARRLGEGMCHQKTTGILSTVFVLFYFFKQLSYRIWNIFWYFYSLVLFQILVIWCHVVSELCTTRKFIWTSLSVVECLRIYLKKSVQCLCSTGPFTRLILTLGLTYVSVTGSKYSTSTLKHLNNPGRHTHFTSKKQSRLLLVRVPQTPVGKCRITTQTASLQNLCSWPLCCTPYLANEPNILGLSFLLD